MPYAVDTKVPASRTRQEIEAMSRRWSVEQALAVLLLITAVFYAVLIVIVWRIL